VQHGVDRIDDRVRHVDELELDVPRVPDGHRLAGGHLHQVVAHVELALILDLLLHQLDGEGRGHDRCIVPVRELRQRPDVVQVPVCGHDRLDVPLELRHDPVVRDRTHVDQVQAVHLLGLYVVVDEDLTQVQPHVEHDHIVSRTDRGHLPSDLLIAANCCDFDFHDLAPAPARTSSGTRIGVSSSVTLTRVPALPSSIVGPAWPIT